MTYDDTDSDADGKIDSDIDNDVVNAKTVSAEEARVGSGTNAPVLNDDRVDGELLVKPSAGDGVGSILLLPDGTDNRSHFLVGNSSDKSNFGGVKWEIEGSTADIQAFSKGTATDPTSLYLRNWDDVAHDAPLFRRDVQIGTQAIIQNYDEAASTPDHKAAEAVQYTDGVGTSATTIWENPSGGFGYVGITIRQGGGDRASELVLYRDGASPKVVDSAVRGTVSGRTYSLSDTDLQLAMDSGTVNVGVKGLGMALPAP